jgi:predicted metalloprotease with PDZ domain
MHETHSYQRVYWSGAALALLADVGLRLGAGERSLDAAMRHLLRCCAAAPRVWTADAALRELDAWAGSPVFTELAASWLPRAEFPELDALYRRLGLDVIDGEVKIRQSAPAAAVRRAIFARPSGRSADP